MRRLAGIVLTLVSAGLTVYSIPASYVALTFFLLGIAGVIVGLRLTFGGRHA